ncbi:MAG: DUF975 family protein [Bacteroidales bacterium]|jgi:uncharacterized membrane protein|nr:DUF975 family protein [Bacteroidales bacterium]
MVTSNKDLMTQARKSLSGRWGLAVGTCFVYLLIMGAIGNLNYAFSSDGSKIAVSLAPLLLGGAFSLGIATFSLAIARNENAELEMIFSGFKYYAKTLGLYLLMVVFVLLWMLLLIVPGIIAAISYSMAFYIMRDNPNIKAMEAINASKKMMHGYKWKYFCLGLRFIGWILLSILSLGIGLLWVVPYMSVAHAKFYDDLKAYSVEAQ